MNAERLLQNFEEISEAPDAVPRLRRFILDLAVRGKLVEQDSKDEPAPILLAQVKEEIQALRESGALKKARQIPDVSEDDRPFTLPQGWEWERFAAVAAIQSNLVQPQGYPNHPHIAPDNIESRTGRLLPYQTVAESKVRSGKHLFFPDHIIYSKIRPNLAKAAIVDFEGLCSADAYPIRPFVDIQFFLKYMLSDVFVEQSVEEANRVAMPKINQDALSKILVPVPPLAEQHRIVAKVNELMALCDEVEAAQTTREKRRDRLVAATLHRLKNGDNGPGSEAAFKQTANFYFNHLPRLTTKPEHVRQLRQTILNLAVRGMLVEQEPEDEPAVNLVRRAEIQKSQLTKKCATKKHFAGQPIDALETRFTIPSSWCWARLGSLCQLVTSGSRGWAKYYSGDGAIFVRMGNLSRGTYKLRMSDVQHVRVPAGGEGTRTRLKENDILISITGEVGLLGLIPPNFGEAYINQHTCLVRLLPVVWSRYFPDLLRSPFAKEHFDAPQRGIKNSYRLSDVSNLPVPLPPLAEQRRIVARVDELMTLCDGLETDLATAVTNHHQLLESVLRQALQRGENAATARPVV